MGQVTPARPMNRTAETSGGTARSPSAATSVETNGLAARVAAVEAARARLGADLEHLETEIRHQAGVAMQKTIWKVVATGTAVAAGLVTKKLLEAGWRAATKESPPNRPEDPAVGWMQAVGWTAATGMAVGVAKLVAARGAAIGMQKAGMSQPG